MNVIYKSPDESTPDTLQPFTRTDGERLQAIRAEVVRGSEFEERWSRNFSKSSYPADKINAEKCIAKYQTYELILSIIDRECAK